MIVIYRLKNCLKLFCRYILYRRKHLGQIIGICINLPVNMLSLFIQHGIIRIPECVKCKAIPRIAHAKLGL